MKTNLPTAITTIKEAATFLYQLWSNGESYHPEDDAHKVDFTKPVTDEEKDKLNNLMEAIYTLPGNVGTYPKLRFDPCMLLNILTNSFGRAKNFDYAISKDDVLELIRPIDPTPDGHTTLLSAIGIFDIMCEDMGEDEDWIGVTGDDYEIIKDDEQYKTFELWIHPSVETRPTKNTDNTTYSLYASGAPAMHVLTHPENNNKVIAIINQNGDLLKLVREAVTRELDVCEGKCEITDVECTYYSDSEKLITVTVIVGSGEDAEEKEYEYAATLAAIYQ